MRIFKLIAMLAGALASGAAAAQRQPVLAQIDLPHSYYYREMYLPQLTSGPSAAAWSPDSKELIYSMAGSLWRQRLGTGVAQQLTAAAAAYDYQPDWSPDGRWVIYSSYAGDAVELWALDLASGESHALTHGGAVNVEPRFSPDGRRIAYVSTAYNKRFHIFTADFDAGRIAGTVRLTGENKSPLPRYYYSAYDHEISPVWSRDGRDIIYVSNRNRYHGTGGIWRIEAKPGSVERELHYEESNWRTRPDISPDGSRLVFSSYYGRSWHNLWLMPAGGGDAFALTFGDWDQTNARWSPDGRQIVFVSNQDGDTRLNLVGVPGGLVQPLAIAERRHLRPTGRILVRTFDSAGKPTPARVSVTDAAGRSYAPDDAWIHADDGYDRRQRNFEAHYFHARGAEALDVPAGVYQIEFLKGFERKLERRRLAVSAGQVADVSVNFGDGAWNVPDPGHWVSGDVHVHMNYAGDYRNTPAHLVIQAQAENLGIVESLVVNKEQRFPDIAYSGRQLDPASQGNALIMHGQEFHSSYWGHLGLLAISGGIILPGYAGYPNTAAASVYPMNADIADIAHARGAVVGYVHPFDEEPLPEAMPRQPLSNELPIDVALGKVDYMEILGFSDHRITAGVWYRLLNLGFRIPAVGGTDAMADFASLHGPVGLNRVYARVGPGPVDHKEWLESLKKGRTFATNGPLLGFELGGVPIGDELKFSAPNNGVGFSARLRSIVPVDHLDIVCNGQVVRSFVKGKPVSEGDFSGNIPLKKSGWCVLRASSDAERYPVLDYYAYATTSPVYVTIAGTPAASPADAKFFSAWVDRVAETTRAYPDWNSETEKRYVMQRLADAKAVFTALE